MKRFKTQFTVLLTLLLAASLWLPGALRAGSNPFEQVAADAYTGRFAGPEVTIRLKPEAGKWSGTILFKGQNFSIQGENQDGKLAGTYGAGDQHWPFTATSDDDNLTFNSGTFTAKLQRQKLPKLEGVFASKRVRLEFQNKDGGLNGLLKFNGEQFPFSATEEAGDLKGVFKNAHESFPFALNNEPAGLTFQTGNFSETVHWIPLHGCAEQFTGQDRWTNGLGMVFVKLPGTPARFGIWDTRVQDYQIFADNNAGVDGSWRAANYQGVRVSSALTHPVTMVSWNDGRAFCAWMTEQERAIGVISSQQFYRLPTDEEWSAAVGLTAEAGSTPEEKDGKIKGVYPWGTQWPPSNGAGNYADNSLRTQINDSLAIDGYSDGYATTSPVGSFAANQFGLYDMGGNVWQWCEDWYNGDQRTRALRGAAWSSSNPLYLASSSRSCDTPNTRRNDIGFRCVLVEGMSR